MDIFSDRLRVVCFVAEDIASRNIDLAEQRDSANGIVVIAGAEQKNQRIAQAIHQSMNLRISAAFGYANRLISLDNSTRFFPTIGALMHLAGC